MACLLVIKEDKTLVWFASESYWYTFISIRSSKLKKNQNNRKNNDINIFVEFVVQTPYSRVSKILTHLH